MLIRMTGLGTVAALLATGVLTVGGLVGSDSGASSGSGTGTALVIDASAARDGRNLVDSRLRDLDAVLRLPRTSTEARTNVRYFDAQGYRLVVAGSQANAAADATAVDAVHVPDLARALAVVGR
jgi:hypothetical protein